jgi:hypothetical protein
MNNSQREDLLSEGEKAQVRALGAARSHDRAASCTHAVLVKVIDRLGMMTSVWVDGELITGAPVLEAHYECGDCGRTLLATANPEAQRAYDTYLEGAEKFSAVLEAMSGVRAALRNHKESTR